LAVFGLDGRNFRNAAHASDSPENAQRKLRIVKPGENNFKKIVEELYGKV